MARKIEDIRNIGIIAHIDAGKTTVTEQMLFLSGAKHRVGRVDQGTAETDSDQEEQDRGITIYSACVTFDWDGSHINLLDTPGHVDFTAEVERCLRVLDGAVVVFSAREGVEAQSETVWRQADRYHVPRIAFINKMDREGADFEATSRRCEARLGANPVVIKFRWGKGRPHVDDPFRGVIDLIEMQLLEFDAEADGEEVRSSEIPEEFAETAEAWREEMLEKLYGYSNELMELALAEQPIPADLIRRVVRDATLHHADSACAVRFGTARDRRAAGAGCGGLLPAQPGRSSAGRGCRSQEAGQANDPQADRRVSRSVGWCSRSCRPRRAICTGSASIPGS